MKQGRLILVMARSFSKYLTLNKWYRAEDENMYQFKRENREFQRREVDGER